MPRDMEPLSLGGTRAFWVRARLLAVRPGQPPYQASPRIASLSVDTLGGTVAAEHATRGGGEVLGRSDGSPNQFLALTRSPILPVAEGETVQVTVGSDVARWTEVDDFSVSGPTDPHYVLHSGSGTLEFGPSVRYADGSTRQHGAIPVDGAEISIDQLPTRRRGGGQRGGRHPDRAALERGLRRPGQQPRTGLGWGGRRDARQRQAPGTPDHPHRPTGGDRRGLRAADPRGLVGRRPGPVPRPDQPAGPVRLLVVPHLRGRPEEQVLDDYALPDGLVRAITDHLEPRRTLGCSIEIGTPYYQGVTVAALIQSLPGRPANLVRQRAMDLLYRYINPLVGGADGSGWAFDTDLNAAPISEMLEAVEGVDRVEEVLIFEFDLRTDQRAGARPRDGPPRPPVPLPLGPPPGGGAVRRNDWLLSQLPMGMLDDDFFVRFVSLFEDVATSYLEGTDNIPNVVDVDVAPPELVRWLGSWIGMPPIDSSLAEDLQRRLVSTASAILAWRGTRQGLEQFLTVVTGGPIEVEESGGIGAVRAPSGTGRRSCACGSIPSGGCRTRNSSPWCATRSRPTSPTSCSSGSASCGRWRRWPRDHRHHLPDLRHPQLLRRADPGRPQLLPGLRLPPVLGAQHQFSASENVGDTGLRRLPGTAGRVAVAMIACPVCTEPNPVALHTCIRCGADLRPPPPPAPVPPPPPPPTPVYVRPPEAPAPTRRWWPWVALIALAVAGIIVLVVLLTD